MMDIHRKPNDWLRISTMTKEFDTHKVTIHEYMNRNSILRILDPQGGNRIVAHCRYIVRTEQPVGNEITKVCEMTMEQLHDEHPWYFAAVRD